MGTSIIKSHTPLYFTLSDRNFLPRTLSMCRSLRQFDRESRIVYFATEPLTEVESLCFAELGIEILNVMDFLGASLFFQLKSERSLLEFMWTLPSVILSKLLNCEETFSDIVYLDADIYFFSDPKVIWGEVTLGNVSIVSHNFSDRLKEIFQDSGEFNVSWVSIPNSEFGREVARNWAENCLELCPEIPVSKNGRFVYGDQRYLDYWPEDFGSRIHVIQNPGVGVAPWNYEKFQISTDNPFLVDDLPLVFYHFSSHQFGFILARKMGSEYSKARKLPKTLYKNYERDLKASAHLLGMRSWKSRFIPLRTRIYNLVRRRFFSTYNR
jgi:hypothetical protein